MEQTLTKWTTRYRAWRVNHYGGTTAAVEDGKLFDSWELAQQALHDEFMKRPAQGTPYDIGGYIERVNLFLALDPSEDEDSRRYVNEPTKGL